MILLNCSNIYHDSTPPKEGEEFEGLFEKKNVKIVRILSSSKIDHKVMSQDEDEWFIMIEGSATIMIGRVKKTLKKGDYCFVAAKQPHQLLSVAQGSIWLAVHIR